MPTAVRVVVLMLFLVARTGHASLPPLDWTEDAKTEKSASAIRTKTIASITSLAIGLGLTVVSVVFGSRALAIRSDLLQTTSPDIIQRHSLIAEGEQARLFSNIGWGASAAAGLVGGLVWVF